MSFLSPLFLLGTLAIAGPILFHLIRRITKERNFFSSVMFLPPTQPRLTQRSRLEHILLLLLRCLALGLLALGFARPFLRKTALLDAGAAAPRRLIVLVDVSASMRRTGLWDEARARAESVLNSVGPGDEAAVFAYSRRANPLISFEEWKAAPVGGRAALVGQRLAATGPGWLESRLGDALIAAAEALGESDAGKKAAGPRQIYLISDLKAGNRSYLESLQSYDWPKNIELKVEALKARNPTNAGVQLVADAADTDRLSTPAVRVRVNNAADSQREQFRVGWTRPSTGEAIGPAVDIYVPPGQSRVVSVPALPNAADMRQISLRGDDEDFDNTVYVVPPEKLRWSVLYFGGEAADDTHAPRFFLERALPNNPHLAVTLTAQTPAAPVAPAELQEAKLYFVTDSLPDGTADGLRAQMLAGKTVLFSPRSAAAAATLARLLGLSDLALTEAQPPDYAMFGEIDFRHPLFAPFADPHYSDFTKIHIWKYRRLKAEAIPAAKVVARFDSGDPALVEIPVGAGRLVALLTSWSPDDSQLAVSSKFVPLIYSLLELAGGPTDEVSQYFAGDAIPLDPARAAGEPTTVQPPHGAAAILPAAATAFTGALEPGIYLLNHGSRSWRIGVNLAASESRTEPLAADELERYGAPGPRPPEDATRTAQREALLQSAEAESRQKLWRWLLGATLAVLLIESALAGWTTRRNGTTVANGGTIP